MRALQHALSRWPVTADYVTGNPPDSWLSPLDGVMQNPRAALLRRVRAQHLYYGEKDDYRPIPMLRLLRTLAEHLDPEFQPVDEMHEGTREVGYQSASKSSRFGGEGKCIYIAEQDYEHAADDSSETTWTVAGLAGACLSVKGYYRRNWSYVFDVEGPAAATIEVARAIARLCRCVGTIAQDAPATMGALTALPQRPTLT